MHTINNRGVPDTIIIDPIGTYKLVVHTIPPVEKTNIEYARLREEHASRQSVKNFITIEEARKK